MGLRFQPFPKFVTAHKGFRSQSPHWDAHSVARLLSRSGLLVADDLCEPLGRVRAVVVDDAVVWMRPRFSR